MALTNLNFNDSEEEIISKYKEEWKISKPDAIKKIIRQFDDGKTKNLINVDVENAN